jgi:hypothetical protein
MTPSACVSPCDPSDPGGRCYTKNMANNERPHPSDSHRLVPIQSFRIVPGIVPDTWILVVEGSAPCANMSVTLVPVVYIRQPEYWRIEAVGTVPGGTCLPAIEPYSATLPLAGVVGTRGIELVGEGFTQQIEVPPPDVAQPCPSHQEQVELPLGKKVRVDQGALTLELVDVQDSRCPSNVICVWAGAVVAKIEATPRGGVPQVVELSSLSGEPVELDGHRLELVNVLPYPIEGVPPPHDPVATVLVTRS